MATPKFANLRTRVADPLLAAKGFQYAGRNSYWSHQAPLISIINLQKAIYGESYTTNLGLHFDFAPTSTLDMVPPEQLHVVFCEIRTRTRAHYKTNSKDWASYVTGTPEERKSELESELAASIQLLADMAAKWKDLPALLHRYTPEALAREVRVRGEINWDVQPQEIEALRKSSRKVSSSMTRAKAFNRALGSRAAALRERSVIQQDYPGWDISLEGIIRVMALLAKRLSGSALVREYVRVALLELDSQGTPDTRAHRMWQSRYRSYLNSLVVEVPKGERNGEGEKRGRS